MSSKISVLPDASALDGTELVPLVQAGGNVKATVADVLSNVTCVGIPSGAAAAGMLYNSGTYSAVDSAITTDGSGHLTAASFAGIGALVTEVVAAEIDAGV